MDVETCETRLIEAAWTLRCLPDPDRKYRNGTRCNLPESVREAQISFGYDKPKDFKVPSPAEISRYEETLDWLRIIPPVREQKFMFWAFESQRGKGKFRIQWVIPRNKSGIGGSNYHCKQLYRSWVQTMARRNI